MKYIQITTVLLVALFLTVFTSCSPDMVEEEALDETDDEVTEILPPEPVPDWDDGVITITVGRFETKKEMFKELKKTFLVDRWAEEYFERMSITPSNERYTVDIAVMSLKEMGFNKPATSVEIEERFRERGFRPLTMEESVEVRLHLPDQPNTATRHKMSTFFALPAEEFTLPDSGIKRTFAVVSVAYEHPDGRRRLERMTGQEGGVLKTLQIRDFSPLKRGSRVIDPKDHNHNAILTDVAYRFVGRPPPTAPNYYDIDFGGPIEGYPGPRFAAAIVGSEKRVQK